MSDLTLQINCSPGDPAYADLTVPRLVAAHRPDIREAIVVVDLCRPLDTPWLYATKQFPESVFRENARKMEEIANRWLADGIVDRVEWLKSETATPAAHSLKALGVEIPCTHDNKGHVFAAYWLALDSVKTKYVVHYDGDMLLHQTPGFSWANEAIERLKADESLMSVSPRICPQASPDEMVSQTASADTAWLPQWKLEPGATGWHSDWISTRCFVMDLDRLRAMQPLFDHSQQQRLKSDAVIAALVRPFAARGVWGYSFPPQGLWQRLMSQARKRIPPYPPSPEVILNEFLRKRTMRALYLRSTDAWLLHPASKPPGLLRIFPQIIDAVCSGNHPEAQKGYDNIRLQAWEEYLKAPAPGA